MFLTLFSFTTKFGGDIIEIYLNKQLLMKQFVHNEKDVKTLTLAPTDMNKQLDIYYRHCGVAGKDRTLHIKDDQGRMVKNWRFNNAAGKGDGMTLQVKEILSVSKLKGMQRLNLYYVSKELPAGKFLATIIYREKAVAKL
jgi:hypothetical protein